MEAWNVDENVLQMITPAKSVEEIDRGTDQWGIGKEGRVGQVPRIARSGDVIFIIEEGPIPFVLRPKGENIRSLGSTISTVL